MAAKKPYVQFSKRMVVLVVASADIFTAAAFFILRELGDSTGIVTSLQFFLIFSGLVFIAYCGNSALEKWALSKVEIEKIQLKIPVATSTSADTVG